MMGNGDDRHYEDCRPPCIAQFVDDMIPDVLGQRLQSGPPTSDKGAQGVPHPSGPLLLRLYRSSYLDSLASWGWAVPACRSRPLSTDIGSGHGTSRKDCPRSANLFSTSPLPTGPGQRQEQEHSHAPWPCVPSGNSRPARGASDCLFSSWFCGSASQVRSGSVLES